MGAPDPRSAWWGRDVEAIISDLEAELEREERRRELTLQETIAVLTLDDALRAAGVEVDDATFSRLADMAIQAGLGGEHCG